MWIGVLWAGLRVSMWITHVGGKFREFALAYIGNGRNTVSRVLFRTKELTEFWGKLGEFCEKLGEFALSHKGWAERSSPSSLPGTA